MSNNDSIFQSCSPRTQVSKLKHAGDFHEQIISLDDLTVSPSQTSGSSICWRRKHPGHSTRETPNKQARNDSKISQENDEAVSESKRQKLSLSSSSSHSSAAEVVNSQTPTIKRIKPVTREPVVVMEKIDYNNSLKKLTYHHRFLKIMNTILENFVGIDPETVVSAMNFDDTTPSELIIGLPQLCELRSEAVKLKSLGAMASLPSDKLVRLLRLLGENIRDGCKVSLRKSQEDNEGNLIGLELTMECISRGFTACLTVLHILTSPCLSRRVYLEHVIDLVVSFTEFQLKNTSFPSFNPGHRIGAIKGKQDELQEKHIIIFYQQIQEVVTLLAQLTTEQVLTDSMVLQLSSLSVSSFFMENMTELQYSSLKLVTAIFSKYEAHRRLLLNDILGSMDKLPRNKRNLRNFKVSSHSGVRIQMLTALILQLVQGVSALPDNIHVMKYGQEKESSLENLRDHDTFICDKFKAAVQTASSFLTAFLAKCGDKSEDCDYRQLFENFLEDLLLIVYFPEWPAAEVVLLLLRNIFDNYVCNKSLHIGLRVASLEYLGLVVARLRKDFVASQAEMETVDGVFDELLIREKQNNLTLSEKFEDLGLKKEEFKIEFAQRLILDYLEVRTECDPLLAQARHFCISSWWWSAEGDIRKQVRGRISGKRRTKRQKVSKAKEDFENSEDDTDSDDEVKINTTICQLVNDRKKFLLQKIPASSKSLTVVVDKIEGGPPYFDYQHAKLITRYWASHRYFFDFFDFYLFKILSASTEAIIAMRTKALGCLSMIVDADPSVLARPDMQMWVHNSLLDHSPAVRETCVDLIGKYMLCRPHLLEQYYDMICTRIMDTAISVRKRVIKVLRDVCVERPSFPKVAEICVKLVKRVNDEDSVRKLVLQVFQRLWFTIEDSMEIDKLQQKSSLITDAVAFAMSSEDGVGLAYFEQLFLSMLTPHNNKNDGKGKTLDSELSSRTVVASQQIVNCLVEHMLRNEEVSSSDQKGPSSSQRFLACVLTLLLFTKVRPQLVAPHASTLESYLSLRSTNLTEQTAVANIASILELVVPCLINPANLFLTQLEESCVRLIFQNNGKVIVACVSCLAAVVNNVTKNFGLVRDCFRQFYRNLIDQAEVLKGNARNTDPISAVLPQIRRSLFTIGLFFRYFDFSEPVMHGDLPANLVSSIFEHLMFFLKQPDTGLSHLALQAVGNVCVRYYDFMLGPELMKAYHRLLTTVQVSVRLKVQVLLNIQLYLTEEENRMVKQEADWKKNGGNRTNIKEMGDVASGMASTVIQIYLKQILESFLGNDPQVRRMSGKVVQVVLKQGLVNPIQIVPYLMCMCTDKEGGIATAAQKELEKVQKTHPQFLQGQLLFGIRLSLLLQRVLAGYCHNPRNPNMLDVSVLPVVRGYRSGTLPKESVSALHGHLYSLLRSSKVQRRAVALLLLKPFEDFSQTNLKELLYFADNLAHLSYQVMDEPLFIIHRVDMIVSVCGSNYLQNLKESLLPRRSGHFQPDQRGVITTMDTEDFERKNDAESDDEDDETIDFLVSRLPEDTKVFENSLVGSQSCVLLLTLKQHLKTVYGLSTARIDAYSPSDSAKVSERPVKRRAMDIGFHPKSVLENLDRPLVGTSQEERRALAEQYLQFKQLMMSLEPEEESDDGEDNKHTKGNYRK